MDAGGLPVFPTNASQAHQLNNHLQLQQQQQQPLLQQNQLNQFQAQQQQQQNLVQQGLSTLCQQSKQQQQQQNNLAPKHKTVVDRLKRRLGVYRRRQDDCIPRFDKTFSGICEQQNFETNALQKRYLESKAKRAQKKTDKKQQDTTLAGNLQSSVHVVSFYSLHYYFLFLFIINIAIIINVYLIIVYE